MDTPWWREPTQDADTQLLQDDPQPLTPEDEREYTDIVDLR